MPVIDEGSYELVLAELLQVEAESQQPAPRLDHFEPVYHPVETGSYPDGAGLPPILLVPRAFDEEVPMDVLPSRQELVGKDRSRHLQFSFLPLPGSEKGVSMVGAGDDGIAQGEP